MELVRIGFLVYLILRWKKEWIDHIEYEKKTILQDTSKI